MKSLRVRATSRRDPRAANIDTRRQFHPTAPRAFGHRYVPATNTGLHSGIDLNRDGVLNTTPATADYGNDALGQAVLVARLDNLGKGASGAAVQNMRLMLGL